MTPRVSVVVPTYNGARYVERAVRSALGQTYSDLEVVVSDDGSTDGTLDVLARIDDPRLSVVAHADRRGAATNWNHAVRLARGELVKLLCQDDELYPDCVQLQVDALDNGAPDRVVLVACRRDIVDDDDRVIHPHRGWKGAPGVADAAFVARATVRAGTNVIGEPSAVLLRKAVLDEVGGFSPDQAYMIDLDAWMRVLEHGRLAYLQATLCTFRVSSTSWSAQLAREQARQGRTLLRAIRDRHPDAVSESDLRAGFARGGALAYARRFVFAAGRVLPERAGGRPPVDPTGPSADPSADVA